MVLCCFLLRFTRLLNEPKFRVLRGGIGLSVGFLAGCQQASLGAAAGAGGGGGVVVIVIVLVLELY